MVSIGLPDSLRYERKFLISQLDRHEVESIVRLHHAMFSETYPERFVNNIYFDDIRASSYFESASGLGRRVKVRVRWYGDLFQYIAEPCLELKTKYDLLGSKMRYPLKPFPLDRKYTREVQQRVFAESGLPPLLTEELGALSFAVTNRYRRKYFESADRNFRITIDWDVQFLRLDSTDNLFAQQSVDHEHTILELKYSQECDQEARQITNRFPFRMTKSSKYVAGMERLHSLVS